ncbi:MAG: hypothetical protein IMX02_11775 [Limnochordaceae bacterium]|nr:hypothetical protein [Limnochordaceae bacterium]
MSAPADLVLTANGPGEISGWLFPVLGALREQLGGDSGGRRDVRVVVWTPPCNFASGREREALERMGGWDLLLGPHEMWQFVLRGRLPERYRPARRGMVVFLGGDLFYAAVVARRLGYAAVAYTEGRARWFWAYERFFVPDESARRRAVGMGASPQRVEVAGDLVVDAIEQRRRSLPEAETGAAARLERPLTVGLFAGSRDFEVRWVLPLLLRAAGMVRERLAGRELRVVAVRSPYASGRAVEEALADAGPQAVAQVEWVTDEDWTGMRRTQAMLECDVAITVPGTVTAELGVLGVPTVTILPLQRPDLIPLEGVPGLVGSLPLVGRGIKAAIVRRGARRVGPLSVPSRRAGRVLSPQLVGTVTPENVAAEVAALLQDAPRRRRLGEELRRAMGPPGAAVRMAAYVLGRLGAGAGVRP